MGLSFVFWYEGLPSLPVSDFFTLCRHVLSFGCQGFDIVNNLPRNIITLIDRMWCDIVAVTSSSFFRQCLSDSSQYGYCYTQRIHPVLRWNMRSERLKECDQRLTSFFNIINVIFARFVFLGVTSHVLFYGRYSCLHLKTCSFWVAFGVFVSRIFFETACFVTFLLISYGYCIMHEQLSLTERRSVAGLTSLLYLTLTGYKAAVPQFAVSPLLTWILTCCKMYATFGPVTIMANQCMVSVKSAQCNFFYSWAGSHNIHLCGSSLRYNGTHRA